MAKANTSERKKRLGTARAAEKTICPACMMPALSNPEIMYQHLTLIGEKNLCETHKPILLDWLKENNRAHLKLLQPGEPSMPDQHIRRLRNRKVKAGSSKSPDLS